MDKKTVEALGELAKAVAKMQGLNPDEVTFSVCNITEPNVCETHCRTCSDKTHHWGAPLSDCSVWQCLHCDHKVALGETSSHPSGCDCPDCMPESCQDGHDWSDDLFGNGVMCEVCGIKAEPSQDKYEYDQTGRWCNECCGYLCMCDEDEDFDNMSL